MEIITTNVTSVKEKLELTVGKGHLSLNDIIDNEPIEITSYIVFTPEEGKRCISIKTSQNIIYSGISAPFIDSFLAFADFIPDVIAEEGKLVIRKLSATSKTNRHYIYCSI